MFNINKKKRVLSFWSLRFGQFCHFSSNLKLFVSGPCVYFYCHFGPKVNSCQINLIKPSTLVLFHRGIFVIYVYNN
ncbi:hypothetical protein Hanom_Chr06g00513201 [Helianthus anomalus]